MANVKISELPVSDPSADSDLIPIVQGSTTKKETRSNWLVWLVTHALTWSLKQTYSASINLASLTANKYLKLNGSKDVVSTDLQTDVLALLLASFSAGSNTALSASDSILDGFSKLQGQVNARETIPNSTTSNRSTYYPSPSFGNLYKNTTTNTLQIYVSGSWMDLLSLSLYDFIVATPSTVNGASGDKAGQISYDSTHLWFCFQNYVNSSTQCWLKVPRVEGTPVEIVVSIPSSSSATGLAGQMAFDTTNNYVFFCIATNTWRRASITLSTF